MKARAWTATKAGLSIVLRAGSVALEADGKGGKPKRKAIQRHFTFATHDKRLAERRLVEVERMRDGLVALGRAAEAELLMRSAAAQADDDERFAWCIAQAGQLPEPAAPMAETVRRFAEQWTGGDLHRQYGHTVRVKKTAERDAKRLAYIAELALPAGDKRGAKVGDLTLEQVTKKDYLHVMGNLPKACVEPNAQRQYGQVFIRLLKVAVKLDRLESCPVPSGMLPKGDHIIATFLYPSEERILLACKLIPIEWRVLWGFLCREGCRLDEAVGILWHHYDTDLGTVNVDDTKTKRALSWDLQPGTIEGLLVLRSRTKRGPFEMFTDHHVNKAAMFLQDHLRLAGLTRPALYDNAGRRQSLRAHDLRATFITLAKLANQSESWITRRTGHASSVVLAGYDHLEGTSARVRAKLGKLARLDVALGVAGDKPLGGGEVVEGYAGHQAPPAPGCEPGAGASEQPKGAAAAPEGGGVTVGVTVEGISVPRVDPSDCESSMISAVVAPAGLEPARRKARDFKSPASAPDPTKHRGLLGVDVPENAGNPIASHPGVMVISESAPISPDPYLAGLRMAAHAAVEAGDRVKLDQVMALIAEATPKAATVTTLHPVKGGRS